jgi:hypothetical protein
MKIIFGKKQLVQVSYYCSSESKEILLDNNAKIAYDKCLATGSKLINTDGTRFTGRNGHHKQDLEAFRLGTYHKTCCNSGWRFNWYRVG